MVARRRSEPVSLTSQRQAIRWATSEKELEKIIASSKSMALADEAHNRWYLEMRFGRPRATSYVVPNLGLPDLDSLDDCSAAMSRVLAAQQSETLTEEDAESYRRTISAAASIHRSKAGEDLLERIEDSAALPFFGPAQTGEQIAAVTAFINAQSQESQ